MTRVYRLSISNLINKILPLVYSSGLKRWLTVIPDFFRRKPLKITPIILRTQARSGSTYLMQLIAEFPDIIVTKTHPYEIRIAQYYAACYNTLSSTSDHETSSRPNYFHRDKGEQWIGANPFHHNVEGVRNHWFKENYNPSLKFFFSRQVEAYYRQEAKFQHKRSPLFFCEKAFYMNRNTDYQSPSEIHVLSAEVKDIFLVRNPLDVLVSHLSFFKNNKIVTEVGIKEVVLKLAKHMKKMARDYNENKSPYVIRYEDLIVQPDKALLELTRYFGLHYGRNTLDEIINKVKSHTTANHITSYSVQGSINRWEEELSPEIIELAKAEMKDYILAFSYSFQ